MNVAHIPVFAGVAWLWAWSSLSLCRSKKKAAIVAGSVTLLFAILNEASQWAVPTRYATLDDVLLNALGVGLGLSVFFVCSTCDYGRRGAGKGFFEPRK